MKWFALGVLVLVLGMIDAGWMDRRNLVSRPYLMNLHIWCKKFYTSGIWHRWAFVETKKSEILMAGVVWFSVIMALDSYEASKPYWRLAEVTLYNFKARLNRHKDRGIAEAHLFITFPSECQRRDAADWNKEDMILPLNGLKENL